MEWRTYSPDGRVIEARRRRARWSVRCEETEATSESLVEAIRQALGYHRNASLATGTTAAEIEQWIRARAAEIEDDRLAGGQ